MLYLIIITEKNISLFKNVIKNIYYRSYCWLACYAWSRSLISWVKKSFYWDMERNYEFN